MTPEQLILMLYKGALDRLELARQGIKENNIAKRGENIGRVIAIVSELNSSLDPLMEDEGTEFLRGLYTAILSELPKVALTNSLEILDRTERYITQLKKIWETDVMGKKHPKRAENTRKNPAPGNSKQQKPAAARPGGYGGYTGGKSSFGSIAV